MRFAARRVPLPRSAARSGFRARCVSAARPLPFLVRPGRAVGSVKYRTGVVEFHAHGHGDHMATRWPKPRAFRNCARTATGLAHTTDREINV